jgi:hypothetical protein
MSREAKRKGREQSKTKRFWFRRQYNLPPNDPRYLAITPEEIEEDYWAHHYFENPTTESGEDEDFDTESILAAMENEDAWEELINDH